MSTPHQESAVIPATDCPTAQPEAIKGCLSCLHVVTHEKCRGCLSDAGKREVPGGTEYLFNYAHWEAGTIEEARARSYALEVSGHRSIVIGHEGEAEVLATQDPATAYRHLCRVAEQCGYFIAAPVRRDSTVSITCCLSHGKFVLTWESGVLASIRRHGVSSPYWIRRIL